MPGDRSGVSAGLTALQLVLEEEQYRAQPAEDLLGRYLNERDERAFAALVRRYGRLVMARCREVVRHEDLAQEAFQETFTQLVVNGQTVKNRGAVGRWLARTARRRSSNIARRERRQRARDSAAPLPIVQPDATSSIDQQDIGRIVSRALSALPERLRLPVELVHIDGLSHAEAANALGWPKGTVDSYVRRGLERLKPLLMRAGLPAVGILALRLPAEAVPADWIEQAVRQAAPVAVAPPPQSLGALLNWKSASLVAATGLLMGVGIIAWQTHGPPETSQVEPIEPELIESLPEQNLRLMREVVAPKVCAAIQPLAKPGTTVSVVATDAYDSRVKCIIEGSFQPKLPGVGQRSRLTFHFDTATWTPVVFIDRHADGHDRWVDLDKPLILAKFPELGIEWTMKLPELTEALEALDELPKDERALEELDRRRSALREQLREYTGTWYRGGDPKQVCRVQLIEPLGLEFWLPDEREPFRRMPESHVWASEGTPRDPKRGDGLLGNWGLRLSPDRRVLTFELPEPPEVPWQRPPDHPGL
jgi:RNA polymerase sigma factor (sigma-70 family)